MLKFRYISFLNKSRFTADFLFKALVCLANQGKTNSDGRIEEHAAFRHRVPELCSVGAIAFLFFGYFHVLNKPVPPFHPDFSVGEYGKREWYGFHVFNALEAEFGADRLRCHAFCWMLSDNSDVADEWRPLYEFYQPSGNKQATIEEIWKEWSVGINGCISVQRLGQYWDTRWRRADKAKKTLASRRKRIIDLVTEIMGKRRWDENRTLRYIRENYVPAKFSTVCAFIDFLQKRQKGLDGLTNFERVVENAM